MEFHRRHRLWLSFLTALAVVINTTTAFLVQQQQQRVDRLEQPDATLSSSRGRVVVLEAWKSGDAKGAALLLDDVSVYRGSAEILSSVDWRVEPRAKWAIVGANGCGKTSLLKAIVGQDNVDCEGGDIIISTTQTVGYLQQTAVAGSNKTIYQEAASAMQEIQDARSSMDEAQKVVEQDHSDKNLRRLESAIERFEAVGGYTQEQTVSFVLKGLGFENMNQRCNELSGGWQMRVSLARLLLSRPTLLLLDEPSNHLDVNARQWLANYLSNYDDGAMILVTHDVSLLQSVSHICEIADGRLNTYKSCTYEEYLQEKQNRVDSAVAEYERNQAKAAKLQGFVDRFGASATKASAAQSRVKQLTKMKEQGLLDAPPSLSSSTTTNTHASHHRPRLVLPDAPKAVGESLLCLKDATFGWNVDVKDDSDDGGGKTTGQALPLLSHVNLDIQKGMKILIRGPNGSGKSTLLAALRGRFDLKDGCRTANSHLRLGVFTQDLAQELDPMARAVDLVLAHARGQRAVNEGEPNGEHGSARGDNGNIHICEQEARSIMGRLGLSQEKAVRQVGDLSGGEKARVALSMFGIRAHNVLLLDEPSNHLDVACIDALAEALQTWDGGAGSGAIVVVSHDRSFCDRIGFTHVGTIDNGTFRLEERSLRESDWNEFEQASGSAETTTTVTSSDDDQSNDDRRKLGKRAYNAPKRIQRLEQLVDEAEVKIASLDDEMMADGSNLDKLLELTSKKQLLEDSIVEYMEEWQELEDLLVTVGAAAGGPAVQTG